MKITGRTLTAFKSAAQSILSWPASPQVTYSLGEPLFRLLSPRRRGKAVDLSQVNRVLVVRLDEIGDIILTSAFLRELRRLLPAARITLVVKPAVYNLVELCPYVNEVLTYDGKTDGRLELWRRHGRAIHLGWRHLWESRFDLAIVPRWDVDIYHAVYLAYFSGAPWRVGFSERVIDHKRRANRHFDRLLTQTLGDTTLRHEVEHGLNLIRSLGGRIQADRLESWTGAEDELFAEHILEANGVDSRDLLIAFSPGAGAPKRVWPLDKFVELGEWLRDVYRPRIVVVGGPGEESLGQEIEQRLGDIVVNLVGKATLRQTGALLQRCHLYVGNDASPMHLAAAAGVPVIEISCHPKSGSPMHLNSPQRFGPWGVPYLVLQPERSLSPCTDGCAAAQAHCIRSIEVEQVKQAVIAQLFQPANDLPVGVAGYAH